MSTKQSLNSLLALLIVAAVAAPAAAQTTANATSGSAVSTAQDDDPDRDPNDSQPDFYVATLNTNLRLPKARWRSASHTVFCVRLATATSTISPRAFSVSIRRQNGLDLKFAPFRGGTDRVYRTSDRHDPVPGPIQRDEGRQRSDRRWRRRQRRRHRQLQRRVLTRAADRAVARARRSAARSTCKPSFVGNTKLDHRRRSTTPSWPASARGCAWPATPIFSRKVPQGGRLQAGRDARQLRL